MMQLADDLPADVARLQAESDLIEKELEEAEKIGAVCRSVRVLAQLAPDGTEDFKTREKFIDVVRKVAAAQIPDDEAMQQRVIRLYAGHAEIAALEEQKRALEARVTEQRNQLRLLGMNMVVDVSDALSSVEKNEPADDNVVSYRGKAAALGVKVFQDVHKLTNELDEQVLHTQDFKQTRREFELAVGDYVRYACDPTDGDEALAQLQDEFSKSMANRLRTALDVPVQLFPTKSRAETERARDEVLKAFVAMLQAAIDAPRRDGHLSGMPPRPEERPAKRARAANPTDDFDCLRHPGWICN